MSDTKSIDHIIYVAEKVKNILSYLKGMQPVDYIESSESKKLKLDINYVQSLMPEHNLQLLIFKSRDDEYILHLTTMDFTLHTWANLTVTKNNLSDVLLEILSKHIVAN